MTSKPRTRQRLSACTASSLNSALLHVKQRPKPLIHKGFSSFCA